MRHHPLNALEAATTKAAMTAKRCSRKADAGGVAIIGSEKHDRSGVHGSASRCAAREAIANSEIAYRSRISGITSQTPDAITGLSLRPVFQNKTSHPVGFQCV